MLVISPVVLLAGAGNPPCQTTASAGLETLAGARAPGGMYAQPLKLNAGRWYEVGATEYGGPGDPTAKSSGAIGGTQGYLPAHPDSFAELSVLDTNPANRGSFTFADANALDNLPYMTGLLVANGRAKRILYKRDVGYGQGPGQTIANGQPYRLDVWWQPASALGISRSPVKITLAPPVGAGNLLQETTLAASTGETANPACDQLAATGMLQLTPGQQARILSDGSAAAPQDAPAAVKRAIAAANQIHTKPYSVNPGGAPEHYGPLATPWPAYDCSGTVS